MILQTSQLVQVISAACSEQSHNAAQLRQTIMQLNHNSQQNIVASEQLSAQAQTLREIVTHFKVRA